MPKILIVDDSPSLSGFLRDVLTRRQYVVRVAADAAKGLMFLKNQKPDLVLVGVQPGAGDGWQGLESLRQASPKTPIAALSDVVTKEVEERAAALGCVAVVLKGLKPEKMLEKVLEVCQARAPLARESAPEATKGRILVVDDEPVIRTVLSRFLKRKGYGVTTAANGLEALEQIKKERPHLMLLDIRMPEMDGFEVLKRVRAIDREIAVMMITANTELGPAQKTMEMGACDYIVKPFHLDYLETTVMAKLLMVTA